MARRFRQRLRVARRVRRSHDDDRSATGEAERPRVVIRNRHVETVHKGRTKAGVVAERVN